MRELDVKEITSALREMAISINHQLSPDMCDLLNNSDKKEESPLGKQILGQLKENMKIAKEEMIPIC